jgi:AcrR family transcriptional regulator
MPQPFCYNYSIKQREVIDVPDVPAGCQDEKPLSRTEAVIISAFLKLMRTTSFEKITVKDIVAVAMINRSTFYLHFKDKYEIAERMQETFIGSMLRALKVIRPAIQLSVNKGNKLFAEFFGERREVMLALLKIKTASIDIEMALKETVAAEYIAESGSVSPVAEARIYADIYVGFLLNHLKSGESFENFASSLIENVINVIISIIDKAENPAIIKPLLECIESRKS